MPELTAADLARVLDARVEGDPDTTIRGVAPLGAAGPGDLTFVERESLVARLEGSSPGAVLVRDDVDLPESCRTVLRVGRPEAAFARAIDLLHPPTETPTGVHETAAIGEGVVLGESVAVGPHVVIEAGARVGDRSVLGPNVLVGTGAVMGCDCRIGHAASVLAAARLGDRVIVHEGARIGTDGFGLATTEAGAVKVPQIGRCVIGDDVEIGANCTIDRGALVDTVIGARTKLDNLVHIAHNVNIGEDCVIVAQVGIAGSAVIESGVTLAGQVGVQGHTRIGAGARVGGQAGVIGDIPAGATYSGYPARPHRESLRAAAASFRLSEALTRLAALEKMLGEGDSTE